MSIKTSFVDFINESNGAPERPVISVTKSETDDSYDVIYTITVVDETFEFTGKATSYDSGRGVFYEFNPTFFLDDESEKYYDDNYESIEEEILQTIDNL